MPESESLDSRARLSIKYGSKSLKLGLCIPWGQRVPVQHHRIGVDAMIPLSEQNDRDPGPRRKDTGRNAATSPKPCHGKWANRDLEVLIDPTTNSGVRN